MCEALVGSDASIDLRNRDWSKVQVGHSDLLTRHQCWNHDLFAAIWKILNVVLERGPDVEVWQDVVSQAHVCSTAMAGIAQHNRVSVDEDRLTTWRYQTKRRDMPKVGDQYWARLKSPVDPDAHKQGDHRRRDCCDKAPVYVHLRIPGTVMPNDQAHLPL